MLSTAQIRNFCIIAHIDHGKSTLADRMLEITGTVEKRKMREQFLDMHPLERERGITIKMTPVSMTYRSHFDRRITQNETRNNAEQEGFLYEDLTYKIRGILFKVRKNIGLGHKEQVYHNALEIEFENAGLKFESKKNISILYDGRSIGTYQPDFVIENKVLVELKALPEIARPQIEQLWSYLKGCDYKLALLVNFGSKDLEIKRIVYDTARNFSAVSGSFLRNSASSQRESAGAEDQIENKEFILNLIDTPGHIDFNYEVSRALAAVEGAVLLVDATQGVEAQTISNVELAKGLKLKIIPVVNKIDLPQARIKETKEEIKNLLGVSEGEILEVSAKTGDGVEELLEEIVERVPPPKNADFTQKVAEQGQRNSASSLRESAANARALIFDFEYSLHRGVIAHVRIFGGEIKSGDRLKLFQAGSVFSAGEVGVFRPELSPTEILHAGEIGYVVTGVKEAKVVRVGDTIANFQFPISNFQPLPGYKEVKPVVFSSLYPEKQDKFEDLKKALERLKLIDSALFFEEESSGVMGRGFRCGFLGMLHLEIVAERLRRDFNVGVIAATPTVKYRVVTKRGEEADVYSPSRFPEDGEIKEILEPWIVFEILMPPERMPAVLKLLGDHEAVVGETSKFSEARVKLNGEMPLRELMRDFFDELKSVSAGYASLNYELADYRPADLLRLDILVAEEVEPAFSKIVPRFRLQREAEAVVEKLCGVLPRALFVLKIQARAAGRILASRTLRALSKDVTGHLYGGDRSRKMKLWKKQKEGKKRLRSRADYNIPPDVFLKIIRK